MHETLQHTMLAFPLLCALVPRIEVLCRARWKGDDEIGNGKQKCLPNKRQNSTHRIIELLHDQLGLSLFGINGRQRVRKIREVEVGSLLLEESRLPTSTSVVTLPRRRAVAVAAVLLFRPLHRHGHHVKRRWVNEVAKRDRRHLRVDADLLGVLPWQERVHLVAEGEHLATVRRHEGVPLVEELPRLDEVREVDGA